MLRDRVGRQETQHASIRRVPLGWILRAVFGDVFGAGGTIVPAIIIASTIRVKTEVGVVIGTPGSSENCVPPNFSGRPGRAIN